MPLEDRAPVDLAALYDAYSPVVYRLAQRLLRDHAAAEDLAHDVFLRFWTRDRYDPQRGPVLAYLLLLTHSMGLNRLRQQSNRLRILQGHRHSLGPADPARTEVEAELAELSERMAAALLAIHPHQRQVLELAYYEGMSQSRIAEVLQIPLGTVKTRSRQGLLALRRHLGDFAAVLRFANGVAAP